VADSKQVADQIIQSVVKKRKISLLDLDESELSDFCPDSAMLNSRYGGRNRVQDKLVRRYDIQGTEPWQQAYLTMKKKEGKIALRVKSIQAFIYLPISK
jgi:hypothetical protein